jgi:hypothetical protein
MVKSSPSKKKQRDGEEENQVRERGDLKRMRMSEKSPQKRIHTPATLKANNSGLSCVVPQRSNNQAMIKMNADEDEDEDDQLLMDFVTKSSSSSSSSSVASTLAISSTCSSASSSSASSSSNTKKHRLPDFLFQVREVNSVEASKLTSHEKSPQFSFIELLLAPPSSNQQSKSFSSSATTTSNKCEKDDELIICILLDSWYSFISSSFFFSF